MIQSIGFSYYSCQETHTVVLKSSNLFEKNTFVTKQEMCTSKHYTIQYKCPERVLRRTIACRFFRQL